MDDCVHQIGKSAQELGESAQAAELQVSNHHKGCMSI